MKSRKTFLLGLVLAVAGSGLAANLQAGDAHHNPVRSFLHNLKHAAPVYDAHGYDAHGYNRHGYNRHGYNRHGHYNRHYDTRYHH